MGQLLMQANRENFGGQQGQSSIQVIQRVCHDGAGLAGQDHTPQRHPGSELPWDGQGCGELETYTAAAWPGQGLE